MFWLFFIPLIASLVAFCFPVQSRRLLKYTALAASLLPLLILLIGQSKWIGAYQSREWFPQLGIDFSLGIDSISLVFLYLTALVIPILLASTSSQNLLHPRSFYGIVLVLQGLLIGFFLARDLVFFTIFWEAMLLPLYFLINLWGGPRCRQAAMQFIIYMLAGSVFMVLAVLALYFSAASQGQATFNLNQLADIASRIPHAGWLAAAFLLAFAVKTPLFPFHAWLPDAYYQASTPGTILLSALLSKAGIYGIMRIGIGLFPAVMQAWSPYLLGWAIAGVFYGGLLAWRQSDYKRLIAYSSLSHVNFILAGLFVWNSAAHTGAILQAFNHGITITALFLAAGWLEERLGSTRIGPAKGMAKFLPVLCWFTLFFVLSSIALPGTNNFAGELLVLFGVFSKSPWLAGFLGLTIILSVIYMLRWMQKVYFEEPTERPQIEKDMRRKEIALSLPLILLILWVGLYPMPIIKQVEPAVSTITTAANGEEAP